MAKAAARGLAARAVAPELLQPLEELLLLAAELLRRLCLDREEQVAASAAPKVRNPLALKPEDVAGLRAGVELHAFGAVERLHLEIGSERRASHRDVENGEQILSSAIEHGVRPNAERDVEVAGRSSAPAGVAGARHPHLEPVGDARGDLDRHAPCALDAAVAVARLARVGDLLARPFALRARSARHHGSEDAPAPVLHLSCAATDATGPRRGSRPGPVPAARRADLERLDRDLALQAEDGFLERQRDGGEHVLAAFGAGATPRPAARAEPSAAEEHVEDLRDVAERELLGAAPATVEVVLLARRGVAADLVRAGDLLEARLRLRRGVHVRVMLAREPPVGLADLVLCGVAGHAEDLVEVSC